MKKFNPLENHHEKTEKERNDILFQLLKNAMGQQERHTQMIRIGVRPFTGAVKKGGEEIK